MNLSRMRGYYSRAALIFLRKRYVRLLFEGGYYSMCGYYLNKYGYQGAAPDNFPI